MQSAIVVPIERLTLQERAYEQLKHLIIGGHFAPGEVLTIRSLAKSLGTSIMPVRDVLQKLAVDQAIIASPNRSFRVAVLTRDDLVEVTTIRKQLEGLAAAMAAESISDLELASLKTLRDASRAAEAAGDVGRFLETNRALCSQIFESSRSPYLEKLIHGAWLRLGPTRRSVFIEWFKAKKHTEHGGLNHDGVVNALSQRSSEAARRAMEEEITAEFEVILRYASFNRSGGTELAKRE